MHAHRNVGYNGVYTVSCILVGGYVHGQCMSGFVAEELNDFFLEGHYPFSHCTVVERGVKGGERGCIRSIVPHLISGMMCMYTSSMVYGFQYSTVYLSFLTERWCIFL